MNATEIGGKADPPNRLKRAFRKATRKAFAHRRLQQQPGVAEAVRTLALLATAGLAFALAGCASLPAGLERAQSRAVVAPDSAPLARLVDASTSVAQRHLSGIRLLADGDDAWNTRLALIRRATHSLDLQTYQIEDDRSGRQLLHELHRAAERGVRVRLLVDDLFAAGLDRWVGALDAHERVEVRLFNPLPARSTSPALRVLLSLHRFEAINRRMHNKLLIADGRLALAGGRNIGDAYFRRGVDANFIDLDVLTSGAVAQELTTLFDAFWNAPLAYPASSLVVARTAWHQLPVPTAPGETVEPGSVAAQIEGGWLALRFAPVRLIADAPAKAVPGELADRPGEAMAQVLQLMRAAHSQVLIVSPYFVPGRLGLELMREASSRGIQLAVMTNSLGATDEPIVHHGYTRYRLQMLQLGVKLAELSPLRGSDETARGGSSASAGRLHAKLAVIDGRWLLVGSMNMDRRSSRLNTEIMLAIDDQLLAREATALMRRWEPGHYQLRLATSVGPIEWIAHSGDGPVVLGAEPHADGLWQGSLRLLSKLVPEKLL